MLALVIVGERFRTLLHKINYYNKLLHQKISVCIQWSYLKWTDLQFNRNIHTDHILPDG